MNIQTTELARTAVQLTTCLIVGNYKLAKATLQVSRKSGLVTFYPDNNVPTYKMHCIEKNSMQQIIFYLPRNIINLHTMDSYWPCRCK